MNAAFATPRAWATTYLGERGISVQRPARATPPRMSSRFVLEHVAIFFGYDADGILNNRRRGEEARVRQIGMYLAYTITGESLPQIARTFKKADHTTVMYARNRIAELLPHDTALTRDVEALRELLEQSFAAYRAAIEPKAVAS